MPTLKTKSQKEKLPVGWAWLVGLMDVHAALEPRLNRDGWLSLHFSSRQGFWKEERDRADDERRYRVLEIEYSPGRHQISGPLPEPWDSEPGAPVVTGGVTAVPRDALVRGVAARPVMKELLAECFGKLAPHGLPEGDSPRSGWMLKVALDANVGVVEAVLLPWNGGEFAATERLTRELRAE